MKITKSQLKRIIKEEIMKAVGAESRSFEDALSEVVKYLDDVANENVYDNFEGNKYTTVEVDTDSVPEEILSFAENGENKHIEGSVEYTFRFYSYDDAEIEDSEPMLYVVNDETGEKAKISRDLVDRFV